MHAYHEYGNDIEIDEYCKALDSVKRLWSEKAMKTTLECLRKDKNYLWKSLSKVI